MSYPHQQVMYKAFTSAGNDRLLASGTGEKARWWFDKNRYVITEIGFAPMVTTAIVTAPKVSLRLVTGGNGKASTTGNQFAVITMATGANQGKWRISRHSGIRKTVSGGSEVTAHVTTAATQACPLRGYIIVEPSWEVVANATGKFTTVTA